MISELPPIILLKVYHKQSFKNKSQDSLSGFIIFIKLDTSFAIPKLTLFLME